MRYILILYAPDSDLEAILISENLGQLGFATVLSHEVLDRQSRLDATQTFFDRLDNSVAVIVVASEGLFSSGQLTMYALAAKDQKKLLPVIFRHEVEPPVWFVGPIRLSSTENSGEMGWNRLAQTLTRLQGELFWQFPHTPGDGLI